MDKNKVVQFLNLQNSRVLIDDWVVIMVDKLQMKSQPTSINEKCLEALEKADYKA